MIWLGAGAPELLDGLAKVGERRADRQGLLDGSLTASSGAIVALLRKSLGSGRIKGFKPHAVAFLGHLISHESHRRSQIVLSLKQSGHPLDKATGYRLWEWGVR
jgi:hypothetical protein